MTRDIKFDMDENKSSLFEETESDGDEYFSVVDEDGVMRCSCGRELIKLDDRTYKCSGGFPIYRFEDGEVLKDKFGNLMLAVKEHPTGDKE